MGNDDAHQMPTCLDRVRRARRKHCVLCLSPFVSIGYSLSQLISDWNNGRILKYPGAMITPEPRTTTFLRVRSDRQHDEIPADFEIIDDVLLDPVVRQDRILRKLLTIEGVRKTVPGYYFTNFGGEANFLRLL